ncbi:MAG: 16S rRNA (guanine(527)-N(7))-methyltransferase RsmG [Rhizobiaceae bacterium]|nr:16S rRNA (guanine(527)-N(7))-methyltransferase RsmG [Rhizobiaceae bacterium]
MTQRSYDSLRTVAGEVSRETFESLLHLDEMLHRWNASINLVAPSTIGQSWERHILDSAQLWPLIGEAADLADLGSGGGFPGLVLATLLKQKSGGSIRLVESNRKKASFLQNAVGALKLPAKVLPERIEKAVSTTPAPRIITARALASLSTLLALAEPWFTSGSRGIFHKGRDYHREIEESTANWRFNLIEHRSRIDADSVILEVSDVARINAG